MSNIHETAIVSKTASVAEGCEIGAYAIVESDVCIGAGSVIGSHAVVCKYTSMGENNIVHPHAVIGNLPQDIGFNKESESFLKIGSGNEFREFTNIHRSKVEGGTTVIGNNCYFMGSSHIAHDCIVGNNVILANSAAVAGHAHIGNSTFISAFCGIHQYVKIGSFVMIGAHSKVTMDIPPFSLVQGITACVYKLNLVGLRRGGVSREEIASIEKIYDAYYSSISKKEFLLNYENNESLSEMAKEFVNFIKKSERGICPRI